MNLLSAREGELHRKYFFLKRISLLGTRSMYNLCGYPGKEKAEVRGLSMDLQNRRRTNRYSFVYDKESEITSAN